MTWEFGRNTKGRSDFRDMTERPKNSVHLTKERNNVNDFDQIVNQKCVLLSVSGGFTCLHRGVAAGGPFVPGTDVILDPSASRGLKRTVHEG